jgi:hypothetical protein
MAPDGEYTPEEREAARARLASKREFRTHVFVYVVVNLLLVVIWAAAGGGYFWPIWSIGGWGIGLAFHAWDTFGDRPITDDDIEAELERGHD